MKGFSLAIVGATGLVGREMLGILEERSFPISQLRLFASERSTGLTLPFKSENLEVERLGAGCFRGVELALFSAGAQVSLKYAPQAQREGAVVVDNSAGFRMEPWVPLVIPEINPIDLEDQRGLVANPNCSTIQMLLALNPIHQAAEVERVFVSTYQSVSGTGQDAWEELTKQSRDRLRGRKPKPYVYPHQIAFNLLPQIGNFNPKGHSAEEIKLAQETEKILHNQRIKVYATTVRVPVFRGHSEAVTLQTRERLTASQAKELLSHAPGVKLMEGEDYPLPIDCLGRDEVLVGRIREGEAGENILQLWVVADNLRKGAALNAVQIAELIKDKL